MQPQTPVRTAIAGMNHGHVAWILRNWQRQDLDIAGFWEPDCALAQRYAGQYKFPLERVYSDLEAMLEAVKPEAVCAFGSIYDHLRVVEACAPRHIHVMVEKPLAVSLEHAEKMASLVRSLGMVYYAIPVEWSSPQYGDFTAFEQVMQHLPPGNTLLHCAANFRVTAFYSLYAVKLLGQSQAQAETFRAQIWEGSEFPIWEQFIGELTKLISGQAEPG